MTEEERLVLRGSAEVFGDSLESALRPELEKLSKAIPERYGPAFVESMLNLLRETGAKSFMAGAEEWARRRTR